MKNKTFKQVCEQVERIYKMYCKGFGCRAFLERADKAMFNYGNVGLMF